HLELLARMVRYRVVFREVKECIVLQQSVLKAVLLDLRQLHIRGDAAAAVDSASTVGQLHFLVRVIVFAFPVVVVVVEGNACVVPLNQAAARCVVLRGSQGQAGVFGQRVNRLHQSLAESGFTRDQAAIVILN